MEISDVEKAQAMTSDKTVTSSHSWTSSIGEQKQLEVGWRPLRSVQRTEVADKDKKLIRKLDFILLPWLFLLLLVSYLDRTNIGNAKLYGLTQDLDMDDGQYHVALSLFYLFYAGFEPITNVLLKRLRPAIFIPVIMLFWGATMACMGLVRNFSDIAAVRVFLGIFEAGLFPGICHYLSCWYKRSELGIRIACFWCAAALAGAFGGLLAAGLAFVKVGDGVYAQGWRWIFIIEGLATVLIGILSFWMVHDYPDQAKFLSQEEHQIVIQRLKEDAQASAQPEDFKSAYFWTSLKDWKTWLYCVVYMGCNMCLASFSLFIPTIIGNLGSWTSTEANLLTVPVYAVAAIGVVFVGWFADRTRLRGWSNVVMSLFGIIGFAILLSDVDDWVKYAATFLGALGIYPCVANTISWMANNIEGVYKRGVTMGIVIGWGNLNGIVASNIYMTKDAPEFLPGHGIVLSYLALFLLGGSLVMHFALAAENKKKRAGSRDYLVEGKTTAEIELLGDQRPDFIYTL